MGYTLINGDDPAVEVFAGAFRKIRVALGATAFGINEIRLPPGAAGREHDEAEFEHEEVYVGLRGSGVCILDGEELPFGPGDYLRVDPDVRRQVRAGPDGLRFLAVGARARPSHDGRSTI